MHNRVSFYTNQRTIRVERADSTRRSLLDKRQRGAREANDCRARRPRGKPGCSPLLTSPVPRSKAGFTRMKLPSARRLSCVERPGQSGANASRHCDENDAEPIRSNYNRQPVPPRTHNVETNVLNIAATLRSHVAALLALRSIE